MFSGRVWPPPALTVDQGEIARAVLLVDPGFDLLTGIDTRLVERLAGCEHWRQSRAGDAVAAVDFAPKQASIVAAGYGKVLFMLVMGSLVHGSMISWSF